MSMNVPNTVWAKRLGRRFTATIVVCCLTFFSVTTLSFAQDSARQPTVFINSENPKLDSIGDPLPPRAIMRLGTQRFQNPSSVKTMALSPDDKQLITLSSGSLYGWDTTTGKQLWKKRFSGSRISGHAYGQRFLCFGEKDPTKLIVCDSDLQLKIVNPQTRESRYLQLQRDMEPADLFRSHGNGITSIDYRDDPDRFLVGSESGIGLYDRRGKMKWYLPNVPKQAIQFGGGNRDRLDFGGDYSSAQFSPGGEIAAALMSDARQKIKLIDLKSGDVDGEIETTAKPVRMVFSPDGKSIFVTERDCGIRCYSIENQKLIWELPIKPDPTGAESYASAIDCSSDGRLIAAGVPVGPKDWVYLVDAKTGAEVAILKDCGWKPWAVQFSSDNQTLYTSGWSGGIKRWDVDSATQLGLPVGIRGSSAVAISPTGNRIAFHGESRV